MKGTLLISGLIILLTLSNEAVASEKYLCSKSGSNSAVEVTIENRNVPACEVINGKFGDAYECVGYSKTRFSQVPYILIKGKEGEILADSPARDFGVNGLVLGVNRTKNFNDHVFNFLAFDRSRKQLFVGDFFLSIKAVELGGDSERSYSCSVKAL